MSYTDLPGFVTSSEDTLSDRSSPSSIRRDPERSYGPQLSNAVVLAIQLPGLPDDDSVYEFVSEPSSVTDSESDSVPHDQSGHHRYVDGGSDADGDGNSDEGDSWTSEDEAIERAANEYISAFDRAAEAARATERFSTRADVYARHLGVWFEGSETFRALQAVQNALAAADEYFEGLRGPDDMYWAEYGHVNSLTDELHRRIYEAYDQILIGDYLLRRGPSMRERLRGYQFQLSIDADKHSLRLMSLVQRALGV